MKRCGTSIKSLASCYNTGKPYCCHDSAGKKQKCTKNLQISYDCGEKYQGKPYSTRVAEYYKNVCHK